MGGVQRASWLLVAAVVLLLLAPPPANTASTAAAQAGRNTTTNTTPTTTTTSTPHEPAKRRYHKSQFWVLAVLPGLALLCAGNRFLLTTVFLGGFAVAMALGYIFLPKVFRTTPYCCGENGTQLGHVVGAAVLGLVGGLLARFLVKAGLFCVGALFGLLVAVVALCTPLKDTQLMLNPGAYVGFYALLMLLGGTATLYAKTFFVILTTSFGGAFLVVFGIDTFLKSNFGQLVVYVCYRVYRTIQHDFRDDAHSFPKFTRPVEYRDLGVTAAWVALGLLGLYLQYKHKRKSGDEDLASARRRLAVQERALAVERQRLIQSTEIY